ncbi:MAG: MG2 domain-containing protein [Bacteroidia bacterium]
MSRRVILAIAAIVVLTMVAIPFLSIRSNSAVTLTKVDPAFSGYVSAFTSGTISNESFIRVSLAADYTGPITLDKPVEENYFSFDPAIEGKTYWLDSRTLEFRPAKRLPSDQVFNADFRLGKLVNDLPGNLSVMKFGFHTMKQGVMVTVDKMRTTDKKTMRRQELRGTLLTTDAADPKLVEQMLNVKQDNKNLRIHWLHEGDNVTHTFTVDSIIRRDKEGAVELAWDGDALGVDQKKSEKIIIPSLKDFKVTDVRVLQGQAQCIIVEFSDPIAEKQNLDGLITLKGADVAMTFTVEDNDIKVYPGNTLSGSYSITVAQGIKNLVGFPLPNTFTQSLTFEELKPQVRLLGKGVILPNSGKGLLFPFEAVSLKSVDVKIVRIYENNIPQFLQVNSLDGGSELYRVGKVIVKKRIDLNVKSKADYGRWCNYSLDMADLIKTEPGAIYRVSISFNKNYAVYSCIGDSTKKDEEVTAPQQPADLDDDYGDAGSYGYYGGDYYDGDYYYYGDGDNADPCDDSYYYGKTITSNIIASDLGLLAKRGNDGGLFFAVNDLLTTNPVSGAELQVFDFQHQLLATTKTGSDGFARIVLPKKKPFLLVAKNGDQRGYLKLDDGSSLSVSAFDVSGASVQKGLKGFIYGERGVWRPGDTLFLNFILEDKQKQLPASHPVTFELTNARGQLVSRVIKNQSLNGFYNFTTPTDPDAPTGTWTCRIKVGGAVFTKDLKVETVMPNRLKILLDFGKATALSNDPEQKVKIESRWLHGAVAKNLKTQVDVSLYQTKTVFKGYENYLFDDIATNFNTENKTIFDDRLDENGKAEFSPQLNATDAPGMLRASFNTRVFEEGGAFSSDRYSVNFSPYDSYVGILVPKGDGWGGMLETGKDWNIRVASVDKNGKPVSRGKINVKVYKVDWRWWWSDDYDNLARYVSSEYYSPAMVDTIETKNGFGKFTLNINDEDYGRYLVRVTDEESGHSTSTLVWMDWPYWEGTGANNMDIASLLQFSSDKTKYNVGETMTLTIPSPGQGRALISIENGSKVINAFWASTDKKGNITYTLPVTAEMSPNIYVHVTLIQPHAQTINDAPIRMYGVIPIEVEDPTTHLNPQIATAAVWKPEEMASVTVSEKDGKPMTYTLAVVDEGLLDLTRFKTPDPWENFYSREALGVKTWDMYDMVMGAYGAEMQRVLGIGGDGENGKSGGQKANRFKPMVKFMGPFELKPGEKQTNNFMMPQYVGSVRVMVITGLNTAYGSAEKTVAVRKPLMILATLPRVVGPGETVELPVDVFAMEKKVKNVTITITPNNLFSVEGGSTQTTSFKDVGDNIVTFRLKVADAIGVGTVKVVATGGGERAEYNIELDVRNPNTVQTNGYEAVLDPGASWNSDYAPFGVSGTNTGTLEFSTVPPLNLGQRLNYLIMYPHGCVEQTTSSVFAQLYLPDLMKLSDAKRKNIDINIRAGINRLKNFQTSSGGLSYWPGENYPSEWGSNYAGHFLLEAETKGYALPAGLMENWKKFQKERALNWTARYDTRYYYNDDLMQAYRLYTLALAKAPELGAMNRLREVKSLSIAAKWRLAAAYQLAGQPDIAKQLVSGLTTTVPAYNELSYTYGSTDRDAAMILETMSLIGGSMRTKSAPLAKQISQSLNSNSYYMNTQATAYSLIALCKFSGADKTTAGINCEYMINKTKGAVNGKETIASVDMNVTGSKAGKATVKNNGTNTLFVRMVLSGIPAAGKEEDAASNLGMTVQFLSMNGTALDPSKIEQGTDFLASVTIFNPGVRGEYKEMALTQIFPSGWEIRNERMEEGPAQVSNDPFDYQDIRDDRVYTYFSIPGLKSRTYTVQLNAAYAGHFYLPAFNCEAMYDHTINARKAGQWVDVVKEERNL